MKIKVDTDSYEIEFSSRELRKEGVENLEAMLNMLAVQSFVMHRSRYDLQMEALREGAGAIHAMSDLSKIKMPREDE